MARNAPFCGHKSDQLSLGSGILDGLEGIFDDVVESFIDFISGAQLVIHNAPFDVGFMDHEFTHSRICTVKSTLEICTVLDTLSLARQMHPGQKNNLDALCKRYGVDNSARELHGALLDAEILADVYLMMTGGQTSFNLSGNNKEQQGAEAIRRLSQSRKPLKIIRASADEIKQHEERLDIVEKEGGSCLWRELQG